MNKMDEQIKEYLENCSIEELTYYSGFIKQLIDNRKPKGD